MSIALIPEPEEIKALETMAKYANDSKFFNTLGGIPGIFSIMMYAKEIGMPPMQAVMGGMHNIQGKIQISPQLMNSMIRKAGHKMEIQSDDLKCTIKGTRKDTGETCSVTFSVEDARKAGLFKTGGGWDKYPSDMCFARAMSRLARRLFPDVIGMSYVEGEIEDDKEPVSRKNRPTESPMEDAKAEVIQDNLEEKFFSAFLSLDQAALKEFISSRPRPEETMRKALADIEGFKSWFISEQEKKRISDDTLAVGMEVLKAI